MLEKHSLEHKEDKEEEDRKHILMVAGIQVIRVKKRVPSEKVKVKEHAIAEEEKEEEEEVFTLTPKKEASLASYAGDYDLKRSLVDNMLKRTPSSVTMRRCKSSVEDQVKMDMRLGINMESDISPGHRWGSRQADNYIDSFT